MKPDSFARLRELFEQALAVEPERRTAFVEASLAPDDPVRSDLLAMLDTAGASRFLATANEVSRSPVHPLPTQIGPYRVLRELGRGGMGIVYLATRNDDAFHKVVAIKVVAGESANLSTQVERFRRERQILAGLEHPGIARLLDGGSTEEGRPYSVMEYVSGVPLDEHCARVGADIPTRVALMAEVCDAVDYLHANAIAHRDLKPANILVSNEGRCKLVDFGIAKLDTVDGLVPGAVAGSPTLIMTPGYASPEQVLGDTVGRLADVYSLGVVLYQLLTGGLPHADSTGLPDVAAQLACRRPTPPSTRFVTARPGTTRHRLNSPDLDHVVLTALERDPTRRYASASLLAEDLRRCLDGRPIAARPATPTYTARSWATRNPLTATLAALLLVSVVGGAGLAIRHFAAQTEASARQDELERVVAILALNVGRWDLAGSVVPMAARLSQMEDAARVLVSEELRTLVRATDQRERVVRLLGHLSTVLDAADRRSGGQPGLRKAVSVAWQRLGDVESGASEVSALRDAGVVAYRRSAAVAQSLRGIDPAWADRQIAELAPKLGGVAAEVLPAETAAPIAALVSGTSSVVHKPTPKPQVAAPAGMSAARRLELTQQLRQVEQVATRARNDLDLLTSQLASQGQVTRADLPASLAQVEGLLDRAREALEADDAEQADESLRRASYALQRIRQVIGG